MTMQWFLRSIGLIFLVFVGLMTVGFFKSDTLVIEHSQTVDALAEDVFPYLNNLELSTQWSPWTAQMEAPEFVFGAITAGMGADVLWRERGNDSDISREEIISSQTLEFVQSILTLKGDAASATYALSNSSNPDRVDVFIRFEQPLGGFPYLQRVTKGGHARQKDAAIIKALNDLKLLVEETP